MADDRQTAPRLGDYHVDETTPSMGTLVENLLARVHALETEVAHLHLRIAELEAAAMPPPANEQ